MTGVGSFVDYLQVQKSKPEIMNPVYVIENMAKLWFSSKRFDQHVTVFNKYSF